MAARGLSSRSPSANFWSYLESGGSARPIMGLGWFLSKNLAFPDQFHNSFKSGIAIGYRFGDSGNAARSKVALKTVYLKPPAVPQITSNAARTRCETAAMPAIAHVTKTRVTVDQRIHGAILRTLRARLSRSDAPA